MGNIAPVKRAASNPHLWIILILLVTVSIFHYIEELGIGATGYPSLHFGLTRHAVDRTLFTLLTIYTLMVFGLKSGLAMCGVTFLVMLPRAIFISPASADALLETVLATLIGVSTCLWVGLRREAREERRRTTMELETMQRELQTHIRLSRSNERRLATLNAIASMLSRSLDVEKVLRNAIEMVMEVMEIEVVLLFSLDKNSQELRLMAYEGVSDAFSLAVNQMKLGEGFNGRVAMTGEPMTVEDASHDPRLTRVMVKKEGIEAQLIVPLRAAGTVVGTMTVANRRPRQFLPEEIDLLTVIGSQIGITVENARLYQQQQLIAGQYRDLFENASDAIWVHDTTGNITAANEAAARLAGYSIKEMTSMNVAQFLTKGGLELAREVSRTLLEGNASNGPYDLTLIRKDGKEVLIRVTSSLVHSDGRPVGFQHVARDITEEKRMQEDMQFYIRAATRAQEEERKRIARELHDETAQRLVALSHQLDNFAHNSGDLSEQQITVLQKLREQVRETLQGVRNFSRDLRPSVLDDLGLLPALEWLTDNLREQYRIKAELKVIGEKRRFTPEVELSLFRIVQEALNNVRRHAQASTVEVVIEFDPNKTIASVRDNGKGFNLPKSMGELPRTGRLGLAGIEERVRLLRGVLGIQSEPDKGTTITVEVPI